MMSMKNGSGANAKQWASVAYTATAAGSSSETVTLPGGQVGKPVMLRGSGSVSGQISLVYGNNAEILVPVNPNAPFSETPIPPTAFPAPTGSVTVTVTADGAGVVRALVGFI
jgi:hypothetical protein